MKITRLRFRVAEMVLAPVSLLIGDGLMHIAEGRPFITEYLLGAVIAVAIVRGMDTLRAATGQWPENG